MMDKIKWTFIFVILASLQDNVFGFCVWDNKYGWWLDCGIRDSYLFRIADIGGVTANFDVGFGVGDKRGFPHSIQNTNHGHFRRKDVDNTITSEIKPVQTSQRRQGPVRNSKPSFGLSVPPPGSQVYRRQDDNSLGGPPLRIFGPKGNSVPIIIKYVTEPTPTVNQNNIDHNSEAQTIGPGIANLLKISDETLADTDHVPSFAAKLVVVREAPKEYYPHDYNLNSTPSKFSPTVKLPRTQFFCEEQKYLPGLYADTQLGCKIFHLCIPASVGSKMQSYLCPNSTLFDQSILQCNWWFNVNCDQSPKHYDANLALAESYRKISAAHLPLWNAQDPNALALLSSKSRSKPQQINLNDY